jgi:hypothetical protein
MPGSAKNTWTLTVAPLNTLPQAVKNLNGGTLYVFGQHKAKATDTFAMITSKLTNGSVDGNSQIAAGAVDENDNVGFIFVSDGTPTGIQYIFQSGVLQHGQNKITGGTITLPASPDADPTDIGTWSGTGGGGDDDDED